MVMPAQVAVDKPEGWRESKKRKGERGETVTKGVAGFANLSAYKDVTKRNLNSLFARRHGVEDTLLHGETGQN
jgi:hypothetical protein